MPAVETSPTSDTLTATEVRHRLAETGVDAVAELALRLVRAASPNPPGSTREATDVAAAILRELVPDAEIVRHETGPGIVNLAARIHGSAPGRRVIFNGHLDTYPVGALEDWTVEPSGVLDGDRLYGRGASDMKGGIAAAILAFSALAEVRSHWCGELVLTLAGDEETMGPLGTHWLMDNLPWATGDAVLIADAGSPQVLRFGEKGFLWVEVVASGRPAHGAHVHRGDNAIDRLRAALDRLSRLPDLAFDTPPAVSEAIAASKPISEPLAGAGEAEVLARCTVNIGQIQGGTSPNLVPSRARAALDIRIPVGLSIKTVEEALARAFDEPGLSYQVLRRFAPNHTDPSHPMVVTCAAAARAVTGAPVAVNMRVGGSDARWFRMAGLPTVVYGPTPHGMGGPDEFVLVSELEQVARVHALTAFDLLQDAS